MKDKKKVVIGALCALIMIMVDAVSRVMATITATSSRPAIF